MNMTGYVGVKEPFAGLFTQGMVCHETYTDASGAWVEPAEIEKRDGKAVKKSTGEAVSIGPSEKMSKSKKNVIAPAAIIDIYGADTVRWFMLSDTPPERDIEWTDDGAEGCWRFVQRIYRLVTEAQDLPAPGAAIGAVEDDALELRRATHKAIAAVTEALDGLKFNTAVAQIYMLANAIAGATAVDGAVRREALEAITLLIAPMTPHLSETCWQALGHTSLVVETPWPKAEAGLTISDSVTIAVQVNGKRRGEITVSRGADTKAVEAAALALDGVVRTLEGKPPRRVIVVPDRIVNIVA
jgi:leucyl-tRNA synthetase